MDEPKVANVLVTDDSPAVRLLIRMVLRKRPCLRLTEAKDGLEALERVMDGGVDLILTDVNMPRMDGLTLIKEVRDRVGRTIPIVVLTTRGRDEDRDRGLALGADAYLTKPFEAEALIRVVENTLGS